MSETLDVVVIGGGIAGLTAAYRLRHRSVAVLEADHRVGGRILSAPRAPHWLNFGAHMFGEPGTVIGDLVEELGLDSRPIRGRLLGISHRGRHALTQRPETYPFILPLSPAARLSLIKVGLALRVGSTRVVRELGNRPAGETPDQRRKRMLSFEEGRTLDQMLGLVHPEVRTILTAITERNGADPSEMSAGHSLRSFANVWATSAPGRNLVGGSSGLPNAIAGVLGDSIRLGARVLEVRREGAGVVVHYEQAGASQTITARRAIIATPAFVTHVIARDLPQATRQALEAIRYGAYLSVAALTSETKALPWDGNYAISTPGRAFGVLFNQATAIREPSGPRRSGGSIMMFRGARGAAELIPRSDAELEALFLADLERTFPGSTSLVAEIAVHRWPAGAPFTFPGRAALQAALTADLGAVLLAGDYLEFPNMEAAAVTGAEAAAKAEASLVETYTRSNTMS